MLRYGAFYGPGTSMAPGEEQFELVRKRKYPLVGNGAGVWSFIHVADAAEATVATVEHGSPGLYNVVDDEPAPVAEWLPALAQSSAPRSRCACPGSSGDWPPAKPARYHDRDPRRVEREGQARARVAPGVRAGVRGSRWHNRSRSTA